MNKTLIAAAVSAALMAPVAAQADEADLTNVTLYGRIHNGIKLNDTDGKESTTDFISVGSRFGIKASSDLGNGLTASAHYEFTTIADKASNSNGVDDASSGIPSTRIATVGLSGGFGSITAGNQWGAYYNMAGVHLDPTFSGAAATYYISAGGHPPYGAPLRTANTIKYSNSFGPVSIELDSRINDSDVEKVGKGVDYTDGFAAGVSVAVNDMITVAGAIDDSRNVTQTGLAAKVSLGNYWASLARHSVNPDGDGADPSATQFWIGGSLGNTSAMLGTGRGDNDGSGVGNEPSDVTLAVYHNMGGGFKLLYEGASYDADGVTGSDFTSHVFAVRLDF